MRRCAHAEEESSHLGELAREPLVFCRARLTLSPHLGVCFLHVHKSAIAHG
jgi:hypothetical protein